MTVDYSLKHKPLTLGIFAHANAGKTTLTEQLLYVNGVIKAAGRVDSGSTASDGMSIERERGISVRSSLMTFALGPHWIQLIDTPGHLEFSAEVESAIHVLDLAIIVVSGVESIEPQTVSVWRAMSEAQIPTIAFINKLDRLGASFNRVFSDLRTSLDDRTLAIGKETSSQFDNRLGLTDLSNTERIDALSLVDDHTSATFLDNPAYLNDQYLDERIGLLTSQSKVIPVFGGSALKASGIKRITDFISRSYPPKCWNENKPPAGFVYKTEKSHRSAQLSYVKLSSGNIEARSFLATSAKAHKIGLLETIVGTKRKQCSLLRAGMIGLLHGPDVPRNSSFGQSVEDTKFTGFSYPFLEVAIEPASKTDLPLLINALKDISIEEPQLEPKFGLSTSGVTISLLGELQLQVVENLLRERFSLDVNFGHPRIIFKETPNRNGIGTAAYTDASGLTLRIRPLPPGSGLVFLSEISTDFFHRKYLRQTERLVRQYLKQGLFGWEIIDIEVAVVDGRFSSAASNSSHFNIAVPIALFRAIMSAGMQLLAPRSQFVIKCHAEMASQVISGLNLSNFSVTHSNSFSIIEGDCFSEEVQNIVRGLSKLTAGTASLSSSFSCYSTTDQITYSEFFGADPRNEVSFVRNDLGGDLDLLTDTLSKLNRATKSKQKVPNPSKPSTQS